MIGKDIKAQAVDVGTIVKIIVPIIIEIAKALIPIIIEAIKNGQEQEEPKIQ